MIKPLTRVFIAIALAIVIITINKSSFGQDPLKDAKTYSEMIEKFERQRQTEQELIEQSTADRDKRFAQLPEDAPAELRDDYQKRVDRFRDSLKEMREVFTRYHTDFEGGVKDIEKVRLWSNAHEESQSAMAAWVQSMVDIYRADSVKYKDIGLTLMELTRRSGSIDRVEYLLEAVRVLFELPPAELDAPLLETIGYVGYANCDFDLAQKAWDQYSTNATLPAIKQAMYLNIANAKEAWTRELQLRELDKTKDNPIVELVTSKGVMTIELFEDDAPASVANFIYLCNNKFYYRVRFFRVIPFFGIQTGCRIGTGTGNAGYTIASEKDLPTARHIFRGSVFFALGTTENGKAMDTSTASAQFILASAAIPQLDNSVTVIGRVIEGQSKIGDFRKVDLSDEEQRKDPKNRTDFLIEANVIKKRDHAYIPTPLLGKLPY